MVLYQLDSNRLIWESLAPFIKVTPKQDITQCNCIVLTHKNYPFVHTFHATPGSFGKEIDNDEIGSTQSDIQRFIDEFNLVFNYTIEANKKNTEFKFDLYIIGHIINPKRHEYLINKLMQHKSIIEVNYHKYQVESLF